MVKPKQIAIVMKHAPKVSKFYTLKISQNQTFETYRCVQVSILDVRQRYAKGRSACLYICDPFRTILER